MNSKNKLQETLKKSPTYYTKKVGGSDHKPEFKSFLMYENQKFSGDIFNNKKSAEEDVAKKVLGYILKEGVEKEVKEDIKSNTLCVYTYPENYDKIILIDLENNPRLAPVAHLYSTSAVIGFTSHCSSIYTKREEYAKLCDLKVLSSSIKDASDIYLVYFLTRMILELPHTRNIPIYILTKDHFASAIVDIFKQEHPDIKIFHVSCAKDIP